MLAILITETLEPNVNRNNVLQQPQFLVFVYLPKAPILNACLLKNKEEQ